MIKACSCHRLRVPVGPRIEDKNIVSLEAFRQAIDEIKQAKPRQVVLFVQRGVHTRFKEIEPNWE